MPKKKEIRKEDVRDDEESPKRLRPETRRGVFAIVLFLLAIISTLSAFGAAGVAGDFLSTNILRALFGFGVVLVPIFLVVFGVLLFRPVRVKLDWYEGVSGIVLFISVLGILHIFAPSVMGGGILGKLIGGSLAGAFESFAAIILLGALTIISFLVLFNEELRLPSFLHQLFHKKEDAFDDGTTTIKLSDLPDESDQPLNTEKPNEEALPPKDVRDGTKKKEITVADEEEFQSNISSLPRQGSKSKASSYVFPPLDLLGRSSGKPGVGDIKAQANLIKRTLLNFGIDVEMDEVSIGPTVTRFALKPAEGIKLARIVALKSDLSLALAAHPIRIEAPIPGKSLVGIELPNKIKASVGLGSLLEDPQFEGSPKRLFTALGKGVTGKSYFADIGKMPHLLIAGTTGSGKSVTVHNLIVSLLYRNSPEDLRFIMVDPKRVELTLYNHIPHLLTPVIKEPKKAILALKWAAREMERRYDILEQASCRDISSYHSNVTQPYFTKNPNGGDEDISAPEKMPYIVIIIDELADIMQAYPRELEAAIVRLAQMSRATGIHLILSTQRPSVNVITGLIKANIPARLALQVSSQIDSRTILDASGAETLLGAGDMLYLGGDMSKPERMQCAFISEEEVKKVVSFIKKNNDALPDEITLGETMDSDNAIMSHSFEDSGDDDELYHEARRVVEEAGKASTSYIQRKLKVGYSRAARLIDLLEERGVVGPSDGAKPREVIGGGGNQSTSVSDETI